MTKNNAQPARYRVLASLKPAVGSTVRHDDDPAMVITITQHGKPWRVEANELNPFDEMDGQFACYAYYRAATAAEIEALVAKEAQAKAEAEVAKAKATVEARRQAALREIFAATDCPDLGRRPEGEELWTDRPHFPIGSRSQIVLTADGWLWAVAYDSYYGQSNCGFNTRGRRIPAREDLLAALRAP